MSSGFTIGMAQYAFGPFVRPLEAEFGWSREQINLSLSLGITGSLISLLVGRWMDRFGARPIMVASLALVASGFLLRAVMTELWQFYLFSVLMFAGFPGATILPAGRLIGIWFARTRGRMMGIVTSGNNFGGLTMVPLATMIVAMAGWRWGYAAFGLIMLAVLLGALFIIRDRREDVERESNKRGAPGRGEGQSHAPAISGYSVREALRLPRFYLITGSLTAAAFTYTAVLTQLYPHMQAEGFSDNAASLGVMLVALFGIVSKLLFGRLSESITARWATVISLAVQSLGLVLFILAGGTWVAWIAVFVFGMGFGGLGALIPLSVAEAFGIKYFGALLGLITMVGVLPQVLGPWMAGRIFDITGSYDVAFTITIALFMTGALFMALARRPAAPPAEA